MAIRNVPAFLVGFGQSVIAHCSDDGEPSGTAGRPALAVLQGSGLGDIGVVVTRYFGGTKLGTGGLVRAYTDAVKAVLEILPLAEKVPTHTVMLVIPYALYEQVKIIIHEFFRKPEHVCGGQMIMSMPVGFDISEFNIAVSPHNFLFYRVPDYQLKISIRAFIKFINIH